MRFSFLAALLTPLLFTLIFTSCSKTASNANAANAEANQASAANSGPQDNVEELGMLVRLPFQAEEVAWKEDPQKKQLTAVLRFSPENATKMAAEIAKNGQPTRETLSVESWYPAELIAQSELTGESTVTGTSFPAEAFLNPPYTKGKITQVENTDYFILQMSS
jgi:hypothetical protein